MCAQKAGFTPKRIMETKELSREMEWYKKRQENGICVRCGNPRNRDGWYCEKCKNKHNERTREERRWYIKHGICPSCRKESLFGSESLCLECSAKKYAENIRSKEKLGKDHINELHRKSSKRAYHERLERGLCTRCGKRKSDHGLKTCGICRARDNRTRRLRCEKPDRSERHEQGLCYFCDNPVKEGYRVCEHHYQKNVENARSGRAKKAREKLLEEGILY